VEEPATAQVKEETTHNWRARDVGAPATLRSFARTIGKEDGGTPGQARTLSGNHLGQATLRLVQREQFESNHRENWATGKEGGADNTDVTSTALGIEKMAAQL
jgi:hypothetical protein